MGIIGNATQIISYLEGKKCKVISAANGHNWGPVDSTFTITFKELNGGTHGYVVAGNGGYITNAKKGGVYTNSIYFTNFTIEGYTIEAFEEQIEVNKKEIKELQEENKSLEARIKFMKENDMEEYDEDVFKSLEVLQLLEKDNLSQIDKAKIIANIIKN